MVNSSLQSRARSTDATGLVGRQHELAEVDRLLDSTQSGLHALLLSGQAGVGKTSLWKAAIERAREREIRVLASRPTEVETQLSFAALVDLVGELADEALPNLPEPQRVALGAALLRISPGSVSSPLAVALAVIEVIRGAADTGPLLIAVDDVQWLDPSSVAALDFALRRLGDSPIGLLVAHRADDGSLTIPPLVASIPPERRVVLEVGTLSVDELAEVVSRVLRLDLRRSTLVRIHELSAGNAFFALEIARALQRRGDRDGREDVPVPATLEALIQDRIDALPAGSVEVALYAAASSPPTRAAMDAALGSDRVGSAIAAGVGAGIFEPGDDVLRFTHPLLPATIYGHASPAERRTVHRALAEAISEPEERARHLALATDSPNAEVAAALEEAAGTARARGAAAAAAELAEASVRLTPENDQAARRRRAMAAAEHHVAAGDPPLARSGLEKVLSETPLHDRGPILAQLGQLLIFATEMDGALRAFEEALPLSADDPALRARIEIGLAGIAHLTERDWTTGARAIAAGLGDAERSGDGALILQAIGHFATWEFHLGRELDPRLIERAAGLERWRPDVVVVEHPDLQFARIHRRLGETGTARRLCERLLADARARGDWSSQPYVYDELAAIEWAAGNWDLAERHWEGSRAAALQAAQGQSIAEWGAVLVQMLALRGDEQACRAAAASSLKMPEGTVMPGLRRSVLMSLGLLELSLGNAAAAFSHLEPALALRLPVEAEPTILGTVPLAVEALVGLGRLEEAAALLEPYDRLARRRGRTVSVGSAEMCRALLLAARGDLDGGLEAAANSSRAFEPLALPFEIARALLVRGEILRRARKKAAAAEAIAASLAIFERLGAERWAARARAALSRSDGRRSASEDLTATQLRVAELAAAGQTNREIADALFMSVHTVEAHLTRIYRVLGVHTRTELAHRFERATH